MKRFALVCSLILERRITVDIYSNGQKLGRPEGGFTPFDFEITNLVREKDNLLVVKVDDKRRRDAGPTLNSCSTPGHLYYFASMKT
jgi:hypothetical protein